jgi:hypothetical protein
MNGMLTTQNEIINIVTCLVVRVTNNLRNTSDDWVYYQLVTDAH